MRVLLIEDDSATAQSIELMLKSESFNVYTTDLGEEGVDLGKLYDYDIILLDLNLPDMSGYEVLRTLRVAKVKTPILILSGLAGIEDKVRGLGFGADDYMTKPFHKDELVARIHAIVRRSKGHAQSVITTGDLTVNLDTKTVEVQRQRVHLTGKEYQMLELLSLRKGTTLTKEMFLNHLYGGMDEPELKIIDVFICKLRKKLAAATGGAELHRDRLGPRLRAARARRARDPRKRLRSTLRSAPALPPRRVNWKAPPPPAGLFLGGRLACASQHARLPGASPRRCRGRTASACSRRRRRAWRGRCGRRRSRWRRRRPSASRRLDFLAQRREELDPVHHRQLPVEQDAGRAWLARQTSRAWLPSSASVTVKSRSSRMRRATLRMTLESSTTRQSFIVALNAGMPASALWSGNRHQVILMTGET